MPNLSKILMMFFMVFASALSGAGLSYNFFCQAANVNYPFPTHSKYPSGTLLPNHLSRERLDELVRLTYEDWKAHYLIEVSSLDNPHHLYRVSAGKSKRKKSLSEGQAYGMMLAVYMAGYDPDAQTIFDGLWMFSRLHPSSNQQHFMAYQIPVASSRKTSAFDGDCDMAYALILADAQWGSEGRIHYLNESRTLTDSLLNIMIGKKSKLPLLGDWVVQGAKKYNQYTIRSSDLLLTHFRLFHRISGNNDWRDVLITSQSLIDQMQSDYSPEAGLLPDFIVGTADNGIFRPASPSFLESRYDGHYYYNAARVPWRLATDAILNMDQTSLGQVRKIAGWALEVSHGTPENIGPGYKLNGKRLRNQWYLSKAFIGPLGVAVMTQPEIGQAFLNRAFDLCAQLKQDYYEDTIGLHCMLLMTGNCWIPHVNSGKS